MRKRSLFHPPLLAEVDCLLMALPAIATGGVRDGADEPRHAGIMACVQRQQQLAEREQNDTELRLRSGLQLAERALLRAAQQAWGGSRKRNARLKSWAWQTAAWRPWCGSSGCRGLSRERAQALQRQLDCEKRDISCVRLTRR